MITSKAKIEVFEKTFFTPHMYLFGTTLFKKIKTKVDFGV